MLFWEWELSKCGVAADIQKQPAGLRKMHIGQVGSRLGSVTKVGCVTLIKALSLSEPVFTSVT